MNILKQFGIILGFAYCGHLLAYGLLVPLPASVIGLVLLLTGLRLRIVSEKWLDDTAHFLSANMAFFFLPSAVEILESYEHIHPVLAKLVLVCIASTIVTFLASYASVRALQKLTGKRSADQ